MTSFCIITVYSHWCYKQCIHRMSRQAVAGCYWVWHGFWLSVSQTSQHCWCPRWLKTGKEQAQNFTASNACFSSSPTFPAVSGLSVGWGLVLVSGWPTVGSAAGTWASGGSCCLQRAGRLLLGVVASSYPLYIALTTRWRHRLILRECKFHHGNNYNLPFSEMFPPGISQFTYRVYRVH